MLKHGNSPSFLPLLPQTNAHPPQFLSFFSCKVALFPSCCYNE
ncbi:hypothetical protein BREVNS_1639 [Brevinematales bacterium NS]|nr:hypothetical protein BREVNS_1639 [Brevinematales bacterium NS]